MQSKVVLYEHEGLYKRRSDPRGRGVQALRKQAVTNTEPNGTSHSTAPVSWNTVCGSNHTGSLAYAEDGYCLR